MEQFQLKPTIFFGSDALAALEGLAGRRVMVITDSFLAQSGLLERVRARLRDCTVEVFDQVVPDPPLELVAQGARALAEFRPQAVVAFGGGSPMDCAKAMLEFGKKLGAGADIRFVAVPTTAGTGSEVTSFAVLTDRAKGVKYPLVDDALLPDEAILDPSLLAGVPPAVTADTGMDVLTHAAEAYVARGATPYTDALAEKAFTLAWQNLRPAWETAGESGAKGNMLLASNLAGIAFNAADGTAAEKYGRLARLCGLAANPRSLAAGLNRLRAQLKLPERLSACGVEGKELTAALDGLAEAAQADLCAPSNPRPAAAEDLKSLLRELA